MPDLFDGQFTPRAKKKATHLHGDLTPDARELIDWWNAQVAARCPKLPRVTGCSEKALRTKLVRARINDPEFMSALETISAGICRNRFLRGDTEPTNGHRNWRCSFEWVLTGDNWRKIAEGYYAADDDAPEQRRRTWRPNRLRDQGPVSGGTAGPDEDAR